MDRRGIPLYNLILIMGYGREASLYWLRDRGRIGEIGVKCNSCGHKPSWPIAEMMQEHGPHAPVSDLWKRWRCAECGSREVVPFSVA